MGEIELLHWNIKEKGDPRRLEMFIEYLWYLLNIYYVLHYVLNARPYLNLWWENKTYNKLFRSRECSQWVAERYLNLSAKFQTHTQKPPVSKHCDDTFPSLKTLEACTTIFVYLFTHKLYIMYISSPLINYMHYKIDMKIEKRWSK